MRTAEAGDLTAFVFCNQAVWVIVTKVRHLLAVVSKGYMLN